MEKIKEVPNETSNNETTKLQILIKPYNPENYYAPFSEIYMEGKKILKEKGMLYIHKEI